MSQQQQVAVASTADADIEQRRARVRAANEARRRPDTQPTAIRARVDALLAKGLAKSRAQARRLVAAEFRLTCEYVAVQDRRGRQISAGN